jgi:acetyl-CoA carboxylase biotin carboxyl carrier protein
MDFKEIQELIKLINKSNLTEFKMEEGDFKISIRTKKFGKMMSQPIIQAQPQMVPIQPAPIHQITAAPQSSATANGPEAAASDNQNNQETSSGENENYLAVKSPIVGTFYRSSSPDKPPYIKIGDSIGVGDVVCIVEAMKLFNEIESEVSGKVVKVMIEDATPVEYDQVLFLVDPKG